VSSWLLARICNKMHGQQNIKFRIEFSPASLHKWCTAFCVSVANFLSKCSSFLPLPTTTTGHYTIFCKKKTSVLRSWRWAKVCPKHVELILEITKTVIVASRWFLYDLTYTDDARSNTNQIFSCLVVWLFLSLSSYFAF